MCSAGTPSTHSFRLEIYCNSLSRFGELIRWEQSCRHKSTAPAVRPHSFMRAAQTSDIADYTGAE
ncbi:hypothetical protein AZE42_08841 [Rhizopogon vesiculosus]|uniref:Uncharacterized protein n=1 Tax=Rhizopogon vesiculosus TaxID=180088 RepID=A0A1J8PQK0_9AGAM|nr:hypothetical protein AZE42_08841 [Rhizopogon vesiculosus]